MHTVLETSETKGRGQRFSVQAVARTCGVLLLLSLVAGGFGEGYVPSRILVPHDAAGTVARLRSLDALFRLGLTGWLIEAMCDISLALGFYVLLRPVRRDLALLAAFFGLVGTTIYAVGEVLFLGASYIAAAPAWLKAFSPGQLDGLALLLINIFGYGGIISVLFYGVATTLRGYLIFRSGFLPAWLGLLMMLGGLAFVARTFAFVLAPAFPSGNFVLLLAPGGLAFTVWLLVRGVDVPKWEMMANGSPQL